MHHIIITSYADKTLSIVWERRQPNLVRNDELQEELERVP